MSVQLRPNKIMDKLRAGEVVSCVKLNLSDSRVAEIAALSGFQCVWLDTEHVPNGPRDIEYGIRSAQAYGIDAIVRVPRGSYTDIIRPLEMDAAGIMVPHVMSPDDARDVVRQTRFHPIGMRALDGGNADGAFCMADTDSYLAQANKNKLVIAQIEDPPAVETLDEIAGLDGIDMLFFGPGDYCHALGIPGEFNDPRVIQARDIVAQAALRHNKYAGTVGSPATIPELIDSGYRFISTGADVVGLGKYFNELAGAFKNIPQGNQRLAGPYA